MTYGAMAYGAMAEVYDELMAEMPYTEWVRFTMESWERYGSGFLHKLVDLGCGTGSTALALADMGISVTGIDLSAEMLAIAEEKRAVAGSTLQWIQQDMREWELTELVDCVISYCDSLNYLLEEADISATFAQTFHGLREGGLFIFDMHATTQLKRYAQEQPFAFDSDRISYIWFSEYDEARREIEHQLTLFVQEPSGNLYRRMDEVHIQRAYSESWIRDALLATGFHKVYTAADFSWKIPSTAEASRLFFAAVK